MPAEREERPAPHGDSTMPAKSARQQEQKEMEAAIRNGTSIERMQAKCKENEMENEAVYARKGNGIAIQTEGVNWLST